MAKTLHPDVYSVTWGCNIYIIDGGADGLVIIDSGVPGARGRVQKAVASLGRTMTDVVGVLLTHCDPDHVGSLRGLAEAADAPIYATQVTADYVSRKRFPPHVPFPMTLTTRIFERLIRWPTVTNIVPFGEPIDLLGGIVPLQTPGHTEDHTAFLWMGGEVLFAGDLFFNFGNKFTLSLPSITWSTDAVRESAYQALLNQPAYVMPGHGPSVGTDVFVPFLRNCKPNGMIAHDH